MGSYVTTKDIDGTLCELCSDPRWDSPFVHGFKLQRHPLTAYNVSDTNASKGSVLIELVLTSHERAIPHMSHSFGRYR